MCTIANYIYDVLLSDEFIVLVMKVLLAYLNIDLKLECVYNKCFPSYN